MADGIAHGRGIEEIKLGCPLNNLMQEMSPLDERFKERLNAILADWGDIVEDALRRDQTAGVLRPDVDCRAAAWFDANIIDGVVNLAAALVVFSSWLSGLFDSYVVDGLVNLASNVTLNFGGRLRRLGLGLGLGLRLRLGLRRRRCAGGRGGVVGPGAQRDPQLLPGAAGV